MNYLEDAVKNAGEGLKLGRRTEYFRGIRLE